VARALIARRHAHRPWRLSKVAAIGAVTYFFIAKIAGYIGRNFVVAARLSLPHCGKGEFSPATRQEAQ
jgi:hypothetical protein